MNFSAKHQRLRNKGIRMLFQELETSSRSSCLYICSPSGSLPCCSVTQSCGPHGQPGSPVLHYLLEFPQTRPLSRWCHPTITSSVAPFSCLQSFPMSLPLSSGGQSIGASTSASVLPMNWFTLGLTGLSSLKPKWLSRVFSNITVQNHQFFGAQPSFMVQLSHPYRTTGSFPNFSHIRAIHLLFLNHWANWVYASRYL